MKSNETKAKELVTAFKDVDTAITFINEAIAICCEFQNYEMAIYLRDTRHELKKL